MAGQTSGEDATSHSFLAARAAVVDVLSAEMMVALVGSSRASKFFVDEGKVSTTTSMDVRVWGVEWGSERSEKMRGEFYRPKFRGQGHGTIVEVAE